ncbi:MAG: 1-deoxy-D-xylulose-5-phosphate synthase [Bacteroidales bacterium]|nr:1-deoxy-D-xylulose-5-phosphate synthase [Bacteroidales bacterium]
MDKQEKQRRYPLLSAIDSPDDLRKLEVGQLENLCAELRSDILDELAQNPGHLASSLGAIELTVALHYVFRTPYDRIVWDVGHQAYAHKILTGRRDSFCTNRKFGGIKPFPSPLESEYDTFACGHASNSISAALGMSTAALGRGETDRHVVAVIGDGAMSGGLAFEGLNNASDTPNNLLIIINDNNMSISAPVGGMTEYLHHVHTSSFYNRLRNRAARSLEKWGMLSTGRRKFLIRFGNALKSAITAQQNVFEGMNIRYFGPLDGHNIKELVHTLERIKDMKGPRILHIHTIKGKGYEPAEEKPTIWHAPGRFNKDTGERGGGSGEKAQMCPPRFQDVFGETLVELARRNPRIMGVTPAMLTGCSMHLMQQAFPERTFDVGIAEGHAMTFSAGMAKEGLQPFCNIYSSFAQRAYDNIIHDAALLNLPVVLCLDRAGLVGEDGPTHHGAFDIPALRPIPHITLCSPYDECELRRMMFTAQEEGRGTFVIRYPRGSGRLTDWRCPLEPLEVGKGRMLKEGNDVAILSFGPIGNVAADAIAEVERQHPGMSIAHFDLRFAKPLDEELVLGVARHFRRIIVLEDGARIGGVGSAVVELVADHTAEIFAARKALPEIVRMGLPDEFVTHGSVAELYALCHLDKDSIIAEILKA